MRIEVPVKLLSGDVEDVSVTGWEQNGSRLHIDIGIRLRPTGEIIKIEFKVPDPDPHPVM